MEFREGSFEMAEPEDRKDTMICPGCGEPIEARWKFCPVCEMPLTGHLCPSCRLPVKENWKRCPECGVSLVCSRCGRRFSEKEKTCPTCGPVYSGMTGPQPVFQESVTGMEFIYVPGGTFMMGDSFGDGLESEQPVHEVFLDSFYLGRYPVTQAQWKALMENNPSAFSGELRPVEQVTWHDAQEFILKLKSVINEKYVFSLPSEAQWEYAARSGGKEEIFSGSDNVDAVAWHEGNSGGMPHPVGKKLRNGLGFFDMSGNVWEWCLDTFDEDAYGSHPQRNPVVIEPGPNRTIRGGSWSVDAWNARCARRFGFRAEFYGPGLGFRVLMVPPF